MNAYSVRTAPCVGSALSSAVGTVEADCGFFQFLILLKRFFLISLSFALANAVSASVTTPAGLPSKSKRLLPMMINDER